MSESSGVACIWATAALEWKTSFHRLDNTRIYAFKAFFCYGVVETVGAVVLNEIFFFERIN